MNDKGHYHSYRMVADRSQDLESPLRSAPPLPAARARLPSLLAPDPDGERDASSSSSPPHIRNPNTRRAYARAAAGFAAWSERHGIAHLRAVKPVHVAAWVATVSPVRSICPDCAQVEEALKVCGLGPEESARIRYRPLSGRYDEGPPRGPIRASLLPAFWPSQSTCRFRPMTWTPSDTTDAIQSVVGLALPFANDGLLQFARGGSLMETVYQNCTTGRSNLFESHRQRRWLTVVSYSTRSG